MANGQAVSEWFQLLRQVDPTPGGPPTHADGAGEGHWGRQPNGSSCTGCPGPPPLLSGNPSVPITFLFPPLVPIPMATPFKFKKQPEIM